MQEQIVQNIPLAIGIWVAGAVVWALVGWGIDNLEKKIISRRQRKLQSNEGSNYPSPGLGPT